MSELVADTINEGLILRATREFKRTASWFVVRNNTINDMETGPCHSHLGDHGDGISMVVNFFQHNYEESHGAGKWSDTTDEEKVMFIDWLANRSPYKDAFLEKDANKMVKWGFCLMTGDCPGNAMGGAVVATRRLWEYTNVLVAWCDLVRGGMNEGVAYCMAHFITGKADKTGKFSWNCNGTGHVTLDTGRIYTDTIHNFVTLENVDWTSKFNKTGNYRSYSDMFTRGGKPIRDIIRTLPKSGKSDANPFAQAAAVYSKDYQSAIADMLSLSSTLMKECKLQ